MKQDLAGSTSRNTVGVRKDSDRQYLVIIFGNIVMLMELWIICLEIHSF